MLQQAHDDLDNLYAATEAMSQDLRNRNETVENLRVKSSMLEAAHQQLEGQITVLRGAVANNEDNIRRSQADIQGQEERSGGIAAQMAQIEERVGQIDLLLKAKEIELDSLQKSLTAMTADAQGITRQFMELRTREVKLTADLAVKEADLRAMESRTWETAQRDQQLQEEIASGEEKEKEAEKNLAACRKELRKAREEITANQNTIAGYTLRQTTRKQRAEEMAQEVQKLQSALQSIQAKARVFRAMEQDLEGYNKSVRQVMQEAKRGSLRNIHGPVSKLIRTEDDYTVAIEIALGAAMQQIVVENEADGKAAISYLKRTGGGRATFLPISALKPKTLQESGLEACAGFVGIASDLITAEAKYQGVVENLLGRTVIVENIDNAIAMAKRYGNRFKIVTLDGQVMNPGGSMTGGSVSKEAGILSRANELEKLTAQEKKLGDKLQVAETQYQEARRAADQVEFQLNTAREQLAEAEKQVLTLEGKEKQHEIWLQAVTDAIAAAQRERDSLKDRNQQDKEQRSAIQAEVRIYRTQLEETRLGLKTLEGSQTEAESAVAGITDKMNTIRSDKAALDAERTTAQSHITDLRILQTAAEGDKEKKLADMDAIRLEIESLQQQIAQQQERQRENDGEIAATRTAMEKALAEYAATEARKSKNESEIQDKNKSIMNMERACALLETKKETTAIEEKNIIDKLWDTYGLTPGTAGEKRGQIESVTSGMHRIAELKRKITNLGTPNLGAIEEYARVNERYTYLTGQRDDVLNSKKELERIIRDITSQMTEIFVTEFQKIDHYFGKVFEEMFGGGKGSLVLEDPNEPLTCGIEIRVQPPGKQLKTITLLSGGEKAFVATALYFAILKVRPTPFCILDEIDAALDDRNVERFSSYLRNLSGKTQFVVITHRRGTMEASDVLYGVTMQEQGISKLLRLDLNQMEQYLGIAE